jgi:hypothetical protein
MSQTSDATEILPRFILALRVSCHKPSDWYPGWRMMLPVLFFALQVFYEYPFDYVGGYVQSASLSKDLRDRIGSVACESPSVGKDHDLACNMVNDLASLQVRLSTLRLAARDALRMTRGPSGLLFLPVSDSHSLLFVDLPAQ